MLLEPLNIQGSDCNMLPYSTNFGKGGQRRRYEEDSHGGRMTGLDHVVPFVSCLGHLSAQYKWFGASYPSLSPILLPYTQSPLA